MPDITGDRPEEIEAVEEGPFDDWEPGPMPIAPDGGMMPGYGLEQPAPPPPMDAEHSPCLRGPCRYYWEIQTSVVAGNPAGTPGIDSLRHWFRSCVFTPSEMELKDTTILECNRWDPIDPGSLRDREYRRRRWHEEHGVIDVEEEDDGPPNE